MDIKDIKKYSNIYIIGPTGAGKTTLAKKLSSKLNYPYFEADEIKWDHKTKEIRPENERDKKLKDIIQKNKYWIIEGAYWQDWTNPIWENCDIAIMCRPTIAKRIFYLFKRQFLKEEADKKTLSLTDQLINIIYTIKFKKCYLPEYIELSKKYKKQIINYKEIKNL